jgi:hypothetical protein
VYRARNLPTVLAAEELEDVRGVPAAISNIFSLRNLALQAQVSYFSTTDEVGKLHLPP